jgi:ribosomal protein S18 acetylase RimI-like enzyme
VIAQRLPARVVFGAWQGESLVGVVGAMQSPKRKTRHSATVWGLYVAPEARDHGIGRALMDALLAEVRAWPEVARVTLSVVDRAVAARGLYSALGFVEFGREPDAYREAEMRDTALHLVLALDDAR